MSTLLIESLDLSEAQFDPSARVLKNVGLITAGKSLNKRYYSEDVLKDAVKVFEGSKSFDSHAKGERRVGELTGWNENVRFENGKLRADRHFLPTRAGQDVMAVVEAVINGGAPRNLAGLSINAIGTGKVQKLDGEDYLHVESISAVNSVDDVISPAAGGSYVESAAFGDELMNAYLNSLTFEEFFNARPEYIKRIQNEMKTARQDEAIKAAKAEANRHLTALTEAQTTIATLTAEREAAIAHEATARRELAIEKALNRVQLPETWKKSLRNHLNESDPQKWESIIEDEIAKAKSSSGSVKVTGAGQQIAPERAENQNVRDPLAAYRARLTQAKTAVEQAAILSEMR